MPRKQRNKQPTRWQLKHRKPVQPCRTRIQRQQPRRVPNRLRKPQHLNNVTRSSECLCLSKRSPSRKSPRNRQQLQQQRQVPRLPLSNNARVAPNRVTEYSLLYSSISFAPEIQP